MHPIAKVLSDLLRRVDGAIGALVVESTGIPVQTLATDPSLNMEDISALVAKFLRESVNMVRDLNLSPLRSITVNIDTLVFLLEHVQDEYWLGLLMESWSNLGLARFEMKRALKDIRSILSGEIRATVEEEKEKVERVEKKGGLFEEGTKEKLKKKLKELGLNDLIGEE